MQTVGLKCNVCNKKIIFSNNSHYCYNCKAAFHNDCLEDKQICPNCNQNFENQTKAFDIGDNPLKEKKSNKKLRCILGIIIILIIYFTVSGNLNNLITRYSKVQIIDLKKNPQKYENKKIIVSGILEDKYSKYSNPLSDIEGYTYSVVQGENKLVFTKSKLIMKTYNLKHGDRLTIRGFFRDGIVKNPEISVDVRNY